MDVSPTSATTPATTASTSSAMPTLSAQDFMNMFTAQLENQDPMQPMDSSSFLNQIAQMDSVETMGELSNTMSGLSNNVNTMTAVAQTTQAQSLIQHQVNYTASDGSTQQATVQSLTIASDGTMNLNLSNQSTIGLGAVTQVF